MAIRRSYSYHVEFAEKTDTQEPTRWFPYVKTPSRADALRMAFEGDCDRRWRVVEVVETSNVLRTFGGGS